MRNILTFFLLCVLFWGCHDDYQPKPRGYFRIDLPQNAYQTCDTTNFCTFRYSKNSKVIIDPMKLQKPEFFNIEYSKFNAIIHLSYKPITNNFDTLTEDARTMAIKHIQKADAIQQSFIEKDEKKVYGIVYDISGMGSASPCQFFLTDTTQHFLRGALYFNLPPNNDSLAPVIEYIRRDIDTLIASFEWK